MIPSSIGGVEVQWIKGGVGGGYGVVRNVQDGPSGLYGRLEYRLVRKQEARFAVSPRGHKPVIAGWVLNEVCSSVEWGPFGETLSVRFEPFYDISFLFCREGFRTVILFPVSLICNKFGSLCISINSKPSIKKYPQSPFELWN